MSFTRAAAIFVAWSLWAIPFFLVSKSGTAERIEKRARWGILIEGIGFACVWAQPAWASAPGDWRWVVAAPFLVLGPLLSWNSARVLGRHWRVDAGLNPDHHLVQAGAYRFVRHPIYLSMFAMLLGTGVLLTRLPPLGVAVLLFVIGTEIRIRIEDGLLASRFGPVFDEYRRRVPAYIPFLR